jgi:hypothetical protein
MIRPAHISAQGQSTTPDGEVLQWYLSPEVYQGAEDYAGYVSLDFFRAKFHASRDSVSVILPPEVAVEIAAGMPKALADLNEMLKTAREGK